jgi:hypothetical protein
VHTRLLHAPRQRHLQRHALHHATPLLYEVWYNVKRDLF